MLQNELFLTNLIHITRLTGPSKSAGKLNLTIRNLPELVADAGLKGRLIELLKVIDEKVKFCLDWRHRRFAHHDLDIEINDKAKPIERASREQMKAVVEAIGYVLNVVEMHYFKGGTGFDFVAMRTGAVTLLYLLDDGLKAQLEREERIKNGGFLPTDVQEQI